MTPETSVLPVTDPSSESVTDLLSEWRKLRLPSSQTVFFYNTKSRHCQFDPPLFEILDLNPEEADNYTKSDIKEAWFTRKQNLGHEPAIVRDAYEILRHTRSRCEYVYKNIPAVSLEARKNAANLLSMLLLMKLM